jgi:hypothetical protein
MKYIEELIPGDCFNYLNKHYILSCDFKNNGKRMCVSLEDGFINWLDGGSIINPTDIFTMDKENNIMAIKERKKDDISNTTQNVS